MKQDVMVIPLRVPRATGTDWKVSAIKQGKSVQRWILDMLDDRITSPPPDAPKPPPVARKQPVVESQSVVQGAEPVKDSGCAQPVSRGRTGSSNLPTTAIPEVSMSKCRHCYDVFPVADMVTDKKTGYLFCVDCVENMKGGQA